MRRWAAGAVLSSLLLGPPALAGTLELSGALTQGGLVVGRTEPGASVVMDGRRIRVSPRGLFLLGFGRDAGPEAKIRILHPGGAAEVRTLEIAKRDFPVQRIDGLPARQVVPGPDDLKRIRAEAALIKAVRRNDRARADFASGFRWPVKGRLSGVYGSQRILNGKPRRPHMGVDIAAPKGTRVVAAAAGMVALVSEDMFFTGKTVLIDHGHGLTSVYAHMSEISVRKGQRVAKGEAIGRVGASGRASGPHLHWGVSLFSTHLDPALLIGLRPR